MGAETKEMMTHPQYPVSLLVFTRGLAVLLNLFTFALLSTLTLCDSS
jgi:hypothetical protein